MFMKFVKAKKIRIMPVSLNLQKAPHGLEIVAVVQIMGCAIELIYRNWIIAGIDSPLTVIFPPYEEYCKKLKIF